MRPVNSTRAQYVVEQISQGVTINQLAEELGVSRQRVSQIYHKYGRRENIKDLHQDQFWTPDKLILLGKKTDSQLGRLWGICALTVGDKRRRLGIPCYRHNLEHYKKRYVGKRNKYYLEVIDVEKDAGRRVRFTCRCLRCGGRTQPIDMGNFAKQKSCGCLLRDIWALGGGRCCYQNGLLREE